MKAGGASRNANGLGIVGFKDFPVTPFSPKFSAVNLKESFSVFPNPTNELATIQYQLSEATAVTISVFDITGRKVVEENLGLKEEGVQTYSLDASKLSKGIFEIIILEGSTVLHQKFVVQ